MPCRTPVVSFPSANAQHEFLVSSPGDWESCENPVVLKWLIWTLALKMFLRNKVGDMIIFPSYSWDDGFQFHERKYDFWCQNLSIALFVQIFGFTIQDIFHNNNVFCQSRGYHQIGDQQRRWKWQEQSFTTHCKRTDEIEWDSTKRKKKKFTYIALAVALKKRKKNSRLFIIFPEFISISKLFPDLDNCWANFKTFSKIQDSARTLFMNGKQTQPVRGTYVL